MSAFQADLLLLLLGCFLLSHGRTRRPHLVSERGGREGKEGVGRLGGAGYVWFFCSLHKTWEKKRGGGEGGLQSFSCVCGEAACLSFSVKKRKNL